jgi:hypothetical protein
MRGEWDLGDLSAFYLFQAFIYHHVSIRAMFFRIERHVQLSKFSPSFVIPARWLLDATSSRAVRRFRLPQSQADRIMPCLLFGPSNQRFDLNQPEL